MAIRCNIITCPHWGARPPRQGIQVTGRAKRIIFHHTDSHHKEITKPNEESLEEGINYARSIQAFHMGPQRGWLDSGHNFLICRSGYIFQGRWLTVSSIEAGHMVISAHCPGQNDQIGIEHEHVQGEKPTDAQLESSGVLMAWIADKYGLHSPLPVFPHHEFYPTSCPDNLEPCIPKVLSIARDVLGRV